MEGRQPSDGHLVGVHSGLGVWLRLGMEWGPFLLSRAPVRFT